MAYLQQQDANRKFATIGAVAAIHGVAIWALVTGLAPDVFREITTVLEGRNIPKELPPPPPAPPQPSPDKKQPTRIDAPKTDLVVPRDGPVIDTFPLPQPVPQPIPQPQPSLAPPPEPVPSFAAKSARPRGRPGEWVTTNDYPSRDLREGNQGTTRFSLLVGADGRVESCVVTRSSGFAGLDEATCRNLSRRARFEPATDESGARVAGGYTGQITWVIPRD